MKEGQIEGWRQSGAGGQKDEQGQKKKGKDAGVGRVREEGVQGDMEEVQQEEKQHGPAGQEEETHSDVHRLRSGK